MQRRRLIVRGIVQGVGFRPFVYRLAQRLALSGFVCNCAGTVVIEIEGDPSAIEQFQTTLLADPPPLARVDQLASLNLFTQGDTAFAVAASDEGERGESTPRLEPGPVFISPDVATCDDCLRELFDPADRRYRYAFINCTNCGPRLTIIRGAPYDRERTTMAAFPMCVRCREEYDDPTNRRFHAQPIGCPQCGPRLSLRYASGGSHPSDVGGCGDPVREFADALEAGRIGAVKGLGGYHLACDAGSPRAVAELRRRKHRDEKPFAVMVRDLAQAEKLAEIGDGERRMLLSAERPIVLVRKREQRLDVVSPLDPHLGLMLPYTPLHHLLLHAVEGPLVMTSGNRSDEPIAYEDADALARLAGIADLFLTHDRPIHVRCDDSVVCWLGERGVSTPQTNDAPCLVRRSRGYAPQPIALPYSSPVPTLAVGGQLKATFALGTDRQAFLSHHLGDLDHLDAYQSFVRDIMLYERLFAVRPERIVHDLHPDYASTRYARERGLPLLSVQHHHAHMAACMAEHGLTEPVIGVIFDGTGYGTDGAVWGGEFLVGDYRTFERAAHFRYVPMPGGERAIREPWRMALAYLEDAGVVCEKWQDRIPEPARCTLAAMVRRAGRGDDPVCAATSSVGRLFDAVASLIGLRDCVSYEGQAAVELEWTASGACQRPGAANRADSDVKGYPMEITTQAGRLVVDCRSLVAAIALDLKRAGRVNTPVAQAMMARGFHRALADLVVQMCCRLRAAGGPLTVVLSGGVFVNQLLTTQTTAGLCHAGFRVHRHRLVPPGDGGLALGQLAVGLVLAPGR